jgi:hypothetical protein
MAIPPSGTVGWPCSMLDFGWDAGTMKKGSCHRSGLVGISFA